MEAEKDPVDGDVQPNALVENVPLGINARTLLTSIGYTRSACMQFCQRRAKLTGESSNPLLHNWDEMATLLNLCKGYEPGIHALFSSPQSKWIFEQYNEGKVPTVEGIPEQAKQHIYSMIQIKDLAHICFQTWDDFGAFLKILEQDTLTVYTKRQNWKKKNGVRVVKYECHRYGKPYYEESRKRKVKEVGKFGSKKCLCQSYIHTETHGTTVFAVCNLTHSGHIPATASDVATLPANMRALDGVSELFEKNALDRCVFRRAINNNERLPTRQECEPSGNDPRDNLTGNEHSKEITRPGNTSQKWDDIRATLHVCMQLTYECNDDLHDNVLSMATNILGLMASSAQEMSLQSTSISMSDFIPLEGSELERKGE